MARLGGDEFALLVPRTDVAGSVEVANALLASLGKPYTLAADTVLVRVSLGSALCPDHGADVAALLRLADTAMYVAKRCGGGYAVYQAIGGGWRLVGTPFAAPLRS